MADFSKIGGLAISALLTTGLGELRGQQFVTDPVGYATMQLIGTGGETDRVENLLANAFTKTALFGGAVASIEGNRLLVSGTPWSPDAFNTASYSHYVELRTGVAAGAILEIVDTEVSAVEVARLPVGAIVPGDEFVIRSNYTINEAFGAQNEAGLLAGANPNEVDNLVVFDPETKTQRLFYFHASEFIAEWREVGQAGDKGGTFLRFPLGVIVVRRAAEDLEYIQFGHVPYWKRFVACMPVWPGQNLLGLPLNHSTLDSSAMFSGGSPFSVVQGANATSADVMIISDASTAERFDPVYFSESEGWRRVGQEGDAGAWEIPFVAAMEYNRVGSAGWIRFQTGLSDGPAAVAARARPAAGDSVMFLEVITVAPRGKGMVAVEWLTRGGASYQLQRMDTGSRSGIWVDYGEAIEGDGKRASVDQATTGAGAYFRVIKLQD